MLLKHWLEEARGRGAALARHLDVPPSMVTKMAAGDKQVPLDHCPLIQAFTGGRVTCEELRPDKVDYFALIRAQASPIQGFEPPDDPRPAPAPSLGATADRRDPARANHFPDLDRRAVVDG